MIGPVSSLHAHANVCETRLQLLERRGYSLHVELGVDDEDPYVYRAERDDFTFTAWNPIELFGLTAIYEEVNPTDSRPCWWCANTQPRARPGRGLDSQIKAFAHEKQEAREAELAALRVAGPEEFRAEVEEWWAEYGDVSNPASRLDVRASARTVARRSRYPARSRKTSRESHVTPRHVGSCAKPRKTGSPPMRKQSKLRFTSPPRHEERR